MIAIVDYGMGNLHSVSKAFEAIGVDAVVTSEPRDLETAERIVLPGVGAFKAGMENLRISGMIEALEEQVRVVGKPFLGICLGMQLIAKEGQEAGASKGLGWLDATVELLDLGDSGLKLPHVGWNEVVPVGDVDLFKGLGRAPILYFVHSYVVKFRGEGPVVAWCDHGGPFVAAVQQGYIMATQFHPEKSQEIGLRLLQNFVDWEPNESNIAVPIRECSRYA